MTRYKKIEESAYDLVIKNIYDRILIKFANINNNMVFARASASDLIEQIELEFENYFEIGEDDE